MGNKLILSVAICGLWAAAPGLAEAADLPIIDQPWEGYYVINGRAAPGSAPITIYDLSYPVRTALGSGKSMDDNGNFAVSVSPLLIAGHKIVAVDKDGNTSQPVEVVAPDPQPDPAQ